MCVYSMVMNHYLEKPNWKITTDFTPYAPTKEEIEEFRKLLERARKYDKEHGEPDCGLDDKKEAIKKLADAWGIEITIP